MLDLIEIGKRKFLRCKNPWGKCSPTLKFHPYDKRRWTKQLAKKLCYTPNYINSTQDNGIFWVLWKDVLKHFHHLSLAWNPSIYPIKKEIHSKWRNFEAESLFFNEQYSLEYNPQYLISIQPHEEDFEVKKIHRFDLCFKMRVMIQKHIKDFDAQGAEKKKNRVSFKLFSFDGYRIIYPKHSLRKFPYSAREICSDVFIFENSVCFLIQVISSL